jgi:hypothetical protein
MPEAFHFVANGFGFSGGTARFRNMGLTSR